MYDTRLINEIMRQAGDIALGHFLDVEPTWKENLTYVTQADLAVQAFLHDAFQRHFPRDGFIAEENDMRRQPRSGTRYWVVDPIDGTAAFAAGLPVWGVGVGLVEEGQPLAGFFCAPVVGDLFYTTPDGHVFRNDRRTKMPQPAAFHRETVLLIASRLHRYYTVSPDYPGKLRNLGSSLAHLCYVAGGNADAALMERVYIWDIAAGMAMLVHNGGGLWYLDGTAVELGPLLSGERVPMPMLAGPVETVSAFRSLITYSGEP
ncbi:MAG: inositol monophosphatase family protein [Anaerolineae bacterium]